MKTNVGVWVDHREAVLVSLAGKGAKTSRIQSDKEKRVRFSGRAQKTSAESRRDRRYAGHLHQYCDKVVSTLRHADSILIFGPGEANVELRARVESEAPGGRITGIETVDKMTVRQLAARVRQLFSQ